MTPRYMLGIESSCDETACALVERDGAVAVNLVSSQVDFHARYGGVVPEVASRMHLEACLPLVERALEEAKAGWDDVAGIAATFAPGLIGCLLIGVETAKSLAWAREKPLHAVHHLKAHLHAPFLRPAPALPSSAGADPASAAPQPAHLLVEDRREFRALPIPPAAPDETIRVARPEFPHVGLIVSGGHTSLAFVEAPGRCRTIATTRDDAVGEAYDKVARALGLGFPGGPVVDRRAAAGNAARFPFTPPMKRRDETDFSFSGLKTAVARRAEELARAAGQEGGPLDETTLDDLCAGFQAAAIEALLDKSIAAARASGVRDLLVVGGVASNRGLRRAAAAAAPRGLRLWFPHFSLCTDNAAMIAGLGWETPALSPEDALELDPVAVLGLD